MLLSSVIRYFDQKLDKYTYQDLDFWLFFSDLDGNADQFTFEYNAQ